MPLFFNRMIRQFANLWNSMNAGQKTGLVILSGLLVLIFAWFLSSMTTFDNFERLIGSEEPPDIRAQVISYLKEHGITYQVRAGETIYVPREGKSEIVLELAGQGVLSDKALYDFLDNVQITTTRQQFDMQVLVAMQRKMENMLRSLTFIRNAKVQITPARDTTVLGFDGEGAKASVLVELMPGKHMSKQHVVGMAQAISAAVQNLKPEDVKIIDTAGRLYRTLPEEGSTFLAHNFAELKESHQMNFEKRIREMLEPVYGVAYVMCSVKLNVETVDLRTTEVKPGEITDSEKTSRTEKSVREGGTPGVVKEATSNEPAGAAKTDFTEKTSKSTQETGSSVESKHIPPGDIKDVTVSVILPSQQDKAKEDMKQVAAIIRNAIGNDIKDEDITVSFMPMPTKEQLPEVTTTASILDMAEKYGSGVFSGIIGLVVLFMLFRIVNNAMAKTRVIDTGKVQEILQKELEEVSKLPREPEMEKIIEDISSVAQKMPKVTAGILKEWTYET